MTAPPIFLLGVSRSGTTLLRVMLDRNTQLAVPDESFFIPTLAERHPRAVDREAFLDDLRRLPSLRDWGVPLDAVAARLRPGITIGPAIAAVYETYAAEHGKARWGDKTPMYMRYLDVIARLFPRATYIHLIRDGRDVAMSFLQMPEGISQRSWALPRTVSDVACMWRAEVTAARRLGGEVGAAHYLEVRYEELVSDPATELERICAHVGLSFELGMLETTGTPSAARPHQRRLLQAPTPGVRDWRREMSAERVDDFEVIAGDLLSELGYERAGTRRAPATVHARRAAYAARVASWRAAGHVLRRSPQWRRRHPLLQ